MLDPLFATQFAGALCIGYLVMAKMCPWDKDFYLGMVTSSGDIAVVCIALQLLFHVLTKLDASSSTKALLSTIICLLWLGMHRFGRIIDKLHMEGQDST